MSQNLTSQEALMSTTEKYHLLGWDAA